MRAKRRNQSRTHAEALAILADRGIPVFMGGAPATLQAAATPYPLGPPTVSGTTITVDTMLNQPTRITRVIQDITLQRFLLDQLFSSDGGVTGGAVIYDQPTANDLYLERDIQRVEPGAEFPIVTSELLQPKTAVVEKWGGKTFITDEARQRNDSSRLMQELRKLGNTIVRKLNQRAVEEVEAIFTTFPGQVIPGNNWTTVTTLGTDPTPYADQPVGDLVAASLHNEAMELGMVHDTLLMNPNQRATLQLIYGQQWQAVLSAYGYTNTFVSNRVAAGVMYSIASGQLGSMRIEKPLGTETWREEKTERTWIQSSVRPLMYIDNPYAVIKFTGLAG